jgi:hypothetical protein
MAGTIALVMASIVLRIVREARTGNCGKRIPMRDLPSY